MIYIITNWGDDFSWHTEHSEATKYLEDLKKAHPGDEWDLIDRKVGRREGHDKVIWGMEGVYNLVTGELELVNRNWFWESAVTNFQELISKISRVEKVQKNIPVYMENVESEGQFINKVLRAFKGIEVQELNEWECKISK
jgi:hypothetical protein